MPLAIAGAQQAGGVITVTPLSHDFGDAVEQVQEVTTSIEIRNDGASNLVVNELKMVGQNTADFHFTAEWPFTLLPGDRRPIIVSFAPTSTGAKQAVLQIISSAGNQPQVDVQLNGNGIGLETLGQIFAASIPNNLTPTPGDLITVDVKVDMRGANPPADLMQSYQASLSWDPAVLSFNGFSQGDQPWGSPASISQSSGRITWFDVVVNGSGGFFSILKPKFRVIGGVGSSGNLTLEFSRMEGIDVENLLPITTIISGSVMVKAQGTGPDIAVTPVSYDYGAVPLGSTAYQTFVIRNEGTQSLMVFSTALAGANANQFSIVSGRAPFVLPPGGSRNLVISFNPTQQGTKTSTLLILSNDPDERAFYVTLAGSVSVPDIEVTPASLDFGNVTVGGSASRTLIVSNRGTAPLILNLFGLDGHQLQFSYNSGTLAILGPGESGSIEVFFHPSDAGAKTATFVIHSNDPDEVSVQIPLSGVGVAPPSN
ncbi:MAG: choice-of-anchor D domain-containing protein [Blastocatellales bacterium]